MKNIDIYHWCLLCQEKALLIMSLRLVYFGFHLSSCKASLLSETILRDLHRVVHESDKNFLFAMNSQSLITSRTENPSPLPKLKAENPLFVCI